MAVYQRIEATDLLSFCDVVDRSNEASNDFGDICDKDSGYTHIYIVYIYIIYIYIEQLSLVSSVSLGWMVSFHILSDSHSHHCIQYQLY